jgi:predicted lipoprotein
LAKLLAWCLVAITFCGLATWHGHAPATKEVRITGRDAWNGTVNNRNRAVFSGKVVRVVTDPHDNRMKISLEADDGAPLTVYQPPTVWGIKWPSYGERVQVKAQQLGPGSFAIVDNDAVKWDIPRTDDKKLVQSMYGYVTFVELLDKGVRRVEIKAEGIVVAVALVPEEIGSKLQSGRAYRFTGFERGDITWITSASEYRD